MKNSTKVILFLSCFVLFVHCKNEGAEKTQIASLDGETLAKIYCASCHQYPKPELLDKKSWEKYVLPRMGKMMGFFKNGEDPNDFFENVNVEKLFPKKPNISPTKWKKIQSFYLSQAPLQLNIPEHQIKVGLENFEVKRPEFTISPPSSTLAKFMEDQSIYVGDALSKKLVQFDNNLDFLKAGNITEGAVHIEEIDNEYWILLMGSFSPTDQANGMLLNLPKDENKKALIIADQLRRPVHASYGDLNGDGKMDIVISEFAKWTGRLTLLLNKGKNEFEQKVLLNQTGATKSFLKDFDNDGRLDIMALFAQGKEGIYIFYNQGEGNFNPVEVLSFHPSMGSSNFEVIDLEKDEDWDIIFTAGDNADFKPILKPYHGVYIFENDGKNHFNEKYFHHINGAYGTKARDFDLDGDLDIAVNSFFPDYSDDAIESFVYLENQGDFTFSASTFEDNTIGRWIVMDAGDKDNDGDLDLILGSLAFEVVPKNGLLQKWIDQGLPFVILENKTK